MFPFYTPTTFRFLMFSGGIEKNIGLKWINRDVFRTLSNIGTYLGPCQMMERFRQYSSYKAVNYLCKKTALLIFDRAKNTPLKKDGLVSCLNFVLNVLLPLKYSNICSVIRLFAFAGYMLEREVCEITQKF